LRGHDIEPNAHDKKYKIKFDIATAVQQQQKEGEPQPDQIVKFCVRILKVEQEAKAEEAKQEEGAGQDTTQKYCVEFQKVPGDGIKFNEHFSSYRKQLHLLEDAYHPVAITQ